MCVCVCLSHSQAVLGDSVILAAVPNPTIATRFTRALTREWLPGESVGACLYRGSVDGMTAAAFHGACDGAGPTLTLIRADEHGRVCVFGGYTRGSWHSDADWGGSYYNGGTYVACGDAFLFCVVGPHSECHTRRFPVRPDKSGFAMYCHPGSGPCFGGDLLVQADTRAADEPFSRASSCGQFGRSGVYADTVGLGWRTFTSTFLVLDYGRFQPVDVEVYAVV